MVRNVRKVSKHKSTCVTGLNTLLVYPPGIYVSFRKLKQLGSRKLEFISQLHTSVKTLVRS